MRLIISCVCLVASFALMGFGGAQAQSAEERAALADFQKVIDRVKVKLKADPRIQAQVAVQESALAYTSVADGNPPRYTIFVKWGVLEEAPQEVWEYIVYHEVCHIRRAHLKRDIIRRESRLRKERTAEACIKRYAGEEEYALQMQALKEWRPSDPKLRAAHALAVKFAERL